MTDSSNKESSIEDSNLIWIDMEMTGLDPQTCHIIEIATIVTDKDLNTIAEGPALVVHQSKELMDGMDEWCTNQHGKSGLTQRVLDSTISVEDAENQTLEFLLKHTNKGKSPLCGNSVGQDRRFMDRYMQKLDDHCSYRIVDVSSVKELAVRWNPAALEGFSKENTHLALDDIRESIGELKHYRSTFFKMPD